MTLQSILGEYLGKAGALDPVVMGSRGTASSTPTRQQQQALSRRVEQRLRESAWLVRLQAVLTTVLLLAGLVLLMRYARTPEVAMGLVGGNLLVGGLNVARLRALWREQVYLEMLCVTLPSLDPSEAAKLLLGMYYGKAGRSGARGSAWRRASSSAVVPGD